METEEIDRTMSVDSDIDLVKKKQACKKLRDDSETYVDINKIGLAEVELPEEEKEGYLPAIQFSINEVSQTVFLKKDIQSKKEALREISDISDVKGKDNVFVTNNNIYFRNLSTIDDVKPISFISALSAAVISGSLSVFLRYEYTAWTDVGLGMLVLCVLMVLCSMISAILPFCLSYTNKVCDFKTTQSINCKINEFIDYETDYPFNQRDIRVVEISERDDNGLRVETTEGDITWIVEGYNGLPTEDLSKYQIGDTDSDIRYVEKALVMEVKDGLTDGLISECGEYVIPTR